MVSRQVTQTLGGLVGKLNGNRRSLRRASEMAAKSVGPDRLRMEQEKGLAEIGRNMLTAVRSTELKEFKRAPEISEFQDLRGTTMPPVMSRRDPDKGGTRYILSVQKMGGGRAGKSAESPLLAGSVGLVLA